MGVVVPAVRVVPGTVVEGVGVGVRVGLIKVVFGPVHFSKIISIMAKRSFKSIFSSRTMFAAIKALPSSILKSKMWSMQSKRSFRSTFASKFTSPYKSSKPWVGGVVLAIAVAVPAGVVAVTGVVVTREGGAVAVGGGVVAAAEGVGDT